MPKKPLIETNPYLRDEGKRRPAIIANVSSSSSVETGGTPEAIARALYRRERASPVKSRQGSGR